MTRLLAILALTTAVAAVAHGDELPERLSDAEPVSELHKLPLESGIDAMPSWAPSGAKIVFHARRRVESKDVFPTRKIWVVDRDGTNPHKLSEGAGEEYHASYSPDGTKILFVAETNGSRDVWVMDAEGKNPLPLTDDPGLEDHPAWSPDGKQIVYTALPTEGGNFDLWVMNADGSGKRKLTFTAANEVFPAWQPVGGTIAFATDVNGNYDLYGIRLGDEKAFPLVTGPANDTRPAWSPDGTKLAFTRWPSEGRSLDATIWVANADGTAATELGIPPPAIHPAWSPDGMTLAFQSGSEGDWDIWTARLPEALVRSGRLHVAAAFRGRRGEDVVKLRGAETVTGTLTAERFGVRAPYGIVTLPRRVLASIDLGDASSGVAKLVTTNGDVFSGFLLEDDVEISTARGKQRLRKEKIASIGFRVDGAASAAGGKSHVVMRNGDAFSAQLKTTALRLNVGSQRLEVPVGDVARVEFGEEGKRTQVVTRKGDTLSGILESTVLELEVAGGVPLSLYPAYIRTLALSEVSS